MTISAHNLNEWRQYRCKVEEQGIPRRVQFADAQIHSWEEMQKIEAAAIAVVEHCRGARNLPGELRYHVDKLTAAIDFSRNISTRATKPAQPV
jgi:hypothetical protein